MKISGFFYLLIGALLLVSWAAPQTEKKTPVDYVNPNMGGIGQLLSATSPDFISDYWIIKSGTFIFPTLRETTTT